MRTAYCFDLDGTISTMEILPCIAAELGVSEEIATLTRLTMEGHIRFDESLRLRALILGQVPIARIHDIIEGVPLDVEILQFINEQHDSSFVVTGNLNVWVEPLRQRISCSWHSSSAEFVMGHLSLTKVLNKGEVVEMLRRQGFDRIVAIGDGANDVPMFQKSDIAIAFGAVHSPTSTAIANSHFVVHSSKSLCNLLKAL